MRTRTTIGRAARAAVSSGIRVMALAPVVAAAPARASGTVPLPVQDAAQTAALAAEPVCPDGLEVLVERAFGAREGLRVGDRLPVGARADGPRCEARVAGIFEPPPDPARLTLERPLVTFHLPHLADLLGRPDEIDRFTVAVEPDVDAAALAARLGAQLTGLQALPTAEVTAEASTTFGVIERFHRAIALITLVAGSVFLACIMFLRVGERRAAIAALRLVGVSKRTLFTWVVAEAALISLLGGVLGMGLGLAASRVIDASYQAVYDTTLRFSLVTPGILARSAVLALGLGLAAGVVAASELLRTDPLEEAGR